MKTPKVTKMECPYCGHVEKRITKRRTAGWAWVLFFMLMGLGLFAWWPLILVAIFIPLVGDITLTRCGQCAGDFKVGD